MFILTEENTIRTITEVTNCKVLRYSEDSLSIQSSFGSDGVKKPSLCYITDNVESVAEWLSKKPVNEIQYIYKIL